MLAVPNASPRQQLPFLCLCNDRSPFLDSAQQNLWFRLKYNKMKKYLIGLLLCLVPVLTQYLPAVSRELGVYSALIYESEDNLNTWRCSQCHLYLLTDRTFFKTPSHNLFGMIGYSSNLKALVAIFRGSQLTNIQNLMTDLKINDVDYPNCQGCRVHRGFYQAFNLQKASFQSTLSTLTKKYPKAPLYLTGHSLGGVFATLTAAQLSSDRSITHAPVYTYGEPRVGNKKFADWFNTRLTQYRVVHYADYVASFPPLESPLMPIQKLINHIKSIHLGVYVARHDLSVRVHQNWLNFQYYHEGTEIWYSSDMKQYRICASEDPTCYNSISDHTLADHDKIYYLMAPANATQVTHFKATHLKY